MAALLLGLAVPGGSASAGERTACVDAYERSQALRRYNDLVGAREELLRCESSCPKRLASDCGTWRAEVERVLPNVVLTAKRADGRAIAIGSLVIDGRKIAATPESPIWLTAGAHAIRVEADGASGELLLSLRPEEHARPVVVVHDGRPTDPATAPDAARDQRAARPLVPAPVDSPSRVPSYVIGGGGAAALLAGGVLSLLGHLERNRLETACAPNCDHAEVDAVRRTWLVGGALSIVGAAALVVAVVVWPARRDRSSSLRLDARSLEMSF